MSTRCSTTPRNGGWRSPRRSRPRKDQPFYHLLAENAETEYVAYVSEQNLLPDTSGESLRHAGIAEMFERDPGRRLPDARPRRELILWALGRATAPAAARTTIP